MAKDLLDVYLEAEEAEGEGSIINEQMLKIIFDVFLEGTYVLVVRISCPSTYVDRSHQINL